MMDPKLPPLDLTERRKRALERMASLRREVAVGEHWDAAKLLHELQVHQIELEMEIADLEQSRDAEESLRRSYAELYDLAPVGFASLDRHGTVLNANLTLAALLGRPRSQLVGQPFGAHVRNEHLGVFGSFLRAVFQGQAREACELELCSAARPAFFVRLEATLSRSGQECRAAILDVHQRRQAEAERNRLIQDLKQALETIKQLSGLLPICAWCKKIRDTDATWVQLEVYIERHSEAHFTHGMCPDCARQCAQGVNELLPGDGAPG